MVAAPMYGLGDVPGMTVLPGPSLNPVFGPQKYLSVGPVLGKKPFLSSPLRE